MSEEPALLRSADPPCWSRGVLHLEYPPTHFLIPVHQRLPWETSVSRWLLYTGEMRAGAVATINKKVVGTVFTKFRSATWTLIPQLSQARAVTNWHDFNTGVAKMESHQIYSYIHGHLSQNKSLHQLLKRYWLCQLTEKMHSIIYIVT